MRSLPIPRTITELKQQFRQRTGGTGYIPYLQFLCQAVLFRCMRLSEEKKPKKKRPLTGWQQFMKRELRKGRAMQDIAADWNEKRGRRNG